jgi:hypothetical protein
LVNEKQDSTLYNVLIIIQLYFQKYTCQLLADTVECDGLLSRCLSHEEVEDTKDGHILARINQYADNKVYLIWKIGRQ